MLLEVWHAALLYVVFVQVLLERLERNNHLFHDLILKDLFFVLWEIELLFDICPLHLLLCFRDDVSIIISAFGFLP